MARTIPERYNRAVGILDVQPNDLILEIGCGYGQAIPLICDKLVDGHLTAIDRSEKMTSTARTRNAAYLESGRVSILHQDLLDRAFPATHFDKIFLFNINVFWMDPRGELAEISRLLKPDGRFYLFHQPPPGHDLCEFENAFRRNLLSHGFTIVSSHLNKLAGVGSLAQVSKKA